MKINMFKIDMDKVDDLRETLENNGYCCEAGCDDKNGHMELYLRRKPTENPGWLSYYQSLLEADVFEQYSKNWSNETVSGILLLEKDDGAYAIVHGQAHFIVRQYCDKDFGLDFAERIIDAEGLRLKHSQTFTTARKKDITAYTNKRDIDTVYGYGEAFSYLKCKTISKREWGETVDFGESVRFSFGKDFFLPVNELFFLVDRIHKKLQDPPRIRLPRYSRVTNRAILDRLSAELHQRFLDFLTDITTEEYWLTGVTFNFSGDYKYELKFKNRVLIPCCDTLDMTEVKAAIKCESAYIGDQYDFIKVGFYDEEGNRRFTKTLQELMQITIENDGHYYVMFHNEWVEFSQTYVEFIKKQVDKIPLEIKKVAGKNEDELIDVMVQEGAYKKLHKNNVYIGKYCIEKADLMDDENVIFIKDQRKTEDLVYLIKQATTSIRLMNVGDLGGDTFRGKNMCLWMLLSRQNLKKLSDLQSFHLLDALNDFQQVVSDCELTPRVWVSLQ